MGHATVYRKRPSRATCWVNRCAMSFPECTARLKHLRCRALVVHCTYPNQLLIAATIAAGVCFRLWGQEDEADMLSSTPPEIVSADLAPLALQLASWGCPDGQGLAWLDAPEPQMLDQARELLLDLCAVDEKGTLTDTGR